MKIKDMDIAGAFAIDMSDEKTFHRTVQEAVDAAIQICGPRKALEAAMIAHHKELHQLFEAISACAKHQQNVEVPLFPLTKDVTDQFNRCVATTAMVAGMMAKDILDMDDTKPVFN